jgi:hypothetical protein
MSLIDTITGLTLWMAPLFGAVFCYRFSPLLSAILLVLSVALVIVPVCGLVVEGLLSFMNRTRKISGGITIAGRLYGEISEHLKQRGVLNAKRYIVEHPKHMEVCADLERALYRRSSYSENDCIAALVYLSDRDPTVTRDSILSIIDTRGVISPEDIKGLLEVGAEVQTPLLDGAL